MLKSGAQVTEPPLNDKPLWDVVYSIYGHSAVLVAHRLRVFSLLAERPRTLPEICSALDLSPRSAEALLAVVAALGFVELSGGAYALTELSRNYLVESSPTYFGDFWDLILENQEACSIASIERAVRTNTSQAYEGAELFEQNERNLELGLKFTRAMHSGSMAGASAWPNAVDLSGCRTLLDIGGGSGAHALGAAAKWPEMQVLLLDLEPICRLAEGYIAQRGLLHRVRTHAADMWTEPFPRADAHLYSNIFHDWPRSRCEFLAKKSFESLATGGRIILHEVLYQDAKTGPFAAAAFSILMLGWTQGQQYSALELREILEGAGFQDVRSTPTFGYYSIVTATKG